MGLESIELVMEFEDVFGVTVPDEVAAAWTTIGETVDWITAELATRLPATTAVCRTQHEFYRLRSDFSGRFGVDRRQIRPRTRTRSVLDPARPHLAYRQFARDNGLAHRSITQWFSGLPSQTTTFGELTYQALTAPTAEWLKTGAVSRPDVLAAVRQITSTQLGVRLEEIRESSRYTEDLNV